MSASLQIYRNFEFGKLMKLIMLDTRIIGRDVQDYNKSTVRVLCSLPCLCTVQCPLQSPPACASAATVYLLLCTA